MLSGLYSFIGTSVRNLTECFLDCIALLVRLSVPSNFVRWGDAFSTRGKRGERELPHSFYITKINLSMLNFIDIAFAIILGFTVVGAVWFLISQKDD
jgi:hypothetical protein